MAQRGKGRALTPEEVAAWVVQTQKMSVFLKEKQALFEASLAPCEPLVARPSTPMPRESAVSPSLPVGEKMRPAGAVHGSLGSGMSSRKTSHFSPLPPPQMDRKTARRLARPHRFEGRSLDLHGYSTVQARDVLLSFLKKSALFGEKYALVITGKGHRAKDLHEREDWGGVRKTLRMLFPLWMAEPDFSALVVAYGPARDKHGGGGAWYVCLRG